ncbi:hypothetical protein HC891_16410 [Candidatus Gracilibacteria bacterium]|nr:hypothetical protein [Candidatus Gracilibacteria bacterium]
MLDAVEEDITASCTVHGTLNYDGDYAVFDGTSTYIECPLPSWRDHLFTLAPGLPGANNDTIVCRAGSLMSGAFNAKLPGGRRANPLIDASALGVSLSLPLANGVARTQLSFTGGGYSSPNWKINPVGNRALLGTNGPAIVAADNYFDWMPYLTSNWQPWFNNNVNGPVVGHLIEPEGIFWLNAVGGYTLATTAEMIYIGHSPDANTYFKGKLLNGKIDPGCRVG